VRKQARAQASLAPGQREAAPSSSDVSPADSRDDPIAVATRLANQGRLREAAEICKRYVQDDRSNAAAFYLLGLVSDAAGDHLEAREHYRKTLYLDPDHTEALVHLAALLEMHGDTAGAKRMNDRARRATIKQLD
jgi:chemotaxis protein methyltransferase WspC